MSTVTARQGFCPARLNPFRVEVTDQLEYVFEQGSWNEHWRRLSAMQFRGAVVGPEGSGKTTLLASLSKRLTQDGWSVLSCRYVPEVQDCLSTLNCTLDAESLRLIIVVDSAEQLSRRIWKRLLKTSGQIGGLIVAVHKPCEIPTWTATSSSWPTVARLLLQLEPSLIGPELTEIAQRLHAEYEGNVRRVFRELYDHVARGRTSSPSSI